MSSTPNLHGSARLRELKNAMSLIQLTMVRTFGHDALLGPDEPPIAIQRGRKATGVEAKAGEELARMLATDLADPVPLQTVPSRGR